MELLKALLASEKNASTLNEYTITDFLGRGGFAHVYKAVSRFTGEQFAIKVYSKDDKKASKSRTANLRKESEILRALKHPNIVKFVEYKETATHIFIVLEYCNGGDLLKYMERRSKNLGTWQLDHKSLVSVLRKIAKVLEFLHNQKMIHRDIKPGIIGLLRKYPRADR